MSDIKLNIKKWVAIFHYSNVSLYGSVRNMGVDSPQSYGFSYSPITKEVEWGVLRKHVPEYVIDAVERKVVELKGKANVRRSY
jgi:hypothetical protein